MEAIEPKKNFLYDLVLPKLELLYTVVSALGGILFWNHTAAGGKLCTVGLGGLAVVYYSRAFKPRKPVDEINFPEQYFKNKDSTSLVFANQFFFLDDLAPQVMYISCAVVLIGCLFKLMFWNGSETMLRVGMLLLTFFVLAWAVNQRVNRRALVVAVVGGLMLSISSENLMRQLYRDDPQLVKIIVYQIHHPHDRAASEACAKQMREYRHNH